MDITPEQQAAMLENYHEAMGEVITLLSTTTVPDEAVLTAIHMLQSMLGMDGAAHLKALRGHEALVMGLLAFRANAVESLLPDTCPACLMPNRTHTERCRYHLAMTLVPEGMPPIEASANAKLQALRNRLHRWSHTFSQMEPAEFREQQVAISDLFRNVAEEVRCPGPQTSGVTPGGAARRHGTRSMQTSTKGRG